MTNYPAPDSIVHFSIRPYRHEDADAVYEAASESIGHISPWMGWLTPAYTRADAEFWVSKAVAEWAIHSYEHLIIDETTGTIAGACGLNHLDRVNRFCNLGYWVRASYLRQGAARAGTLLLRDFGFGLAGMNRLEIVVAVGNAPSRKVAESAGAIHEGVLRKRLCVGEISHDSHMFVFIREGI